MYQKLVSHNADIRRLVEKGYAVGFDSNYLIIRDVPYLAADLSLRIGAIVTKLRFPVDDAHVEQEDHQIFFAGSVPYGLDGAPIPNLGGGPTPLALSEASNDVSVERSFSNKPRSTGRFTDFFEKIESYVGIISGPAMARFDVTPLTFRFVTSEEDSVFKLRDTMTSRAEITDLSAKLKNEVVAVIGAGGTGGYLIDFLVKMPVREIRIFDRDAFHVHNAFRSPGGLEQSDLGVPKAEVYRRRYENFRNGLVAHSKFVDASSAEDLVGVTFAFVSVDRGSSRAGIFDVLLANRIPFIDVGMGLKRKETLLNGMLRATYYSGEQGAQVREKGLAELHDQPDDLYRANIQISELNALNASLAVIRYKQLRGFYSGAASLYHLLFEIADLKIVSASHGDED